jgi:hypothetical protein
MTLRVVSGASTTPVANAVATHGVGQNGQVINSPSE